MKRYTFSLLLCCLVGGALVLVAVFSAAAQRSSCGGEGQRACTISPAAYVGRKPSGCPAGSFFDPIDSGTC